MVGCITGGGKVLACGNGGSAADAQHFAAEFVGRFERERPGLAAVALTVDSSILTAIANDYDYERSSPSRSQALGSPGDVLLAITTSGNSANVLAAVDAAHAREMTVVALTGRRRRACASCSPRPTSTSASRTSARRASRRCTCWSLHCLCDAVDLQLLGEQENT